MKIPRPHAVFPVSRYVATMLISFSGTPVTHIPRKTFKVPCSIPIEGYHTVCVKASFAFVVYCVGEICKLIV